ncbi:hypothetical protein ACEQPO_07235 [Bacillus sp. SL00103]
MPFLHGPTSQKLKGLMENTDQAKHIFQLLKKPIRSGKKMPAQRHLFVFYARYFL